jgi:hypothetical protein
MAWNVGDKAEFNGNGIVIVEKFKGGKTTKPNMQSGAMFTGFHSKPPTYLLSSGQRVHGNKLKRIRNSTTKI